MLGPLNVPRPVQGWPVIVQAGASDEGKETAAEFGEAIFSPHLTLNQRSNTTTTSAACANTGAIPII